jgi:hypothetical protein
MIKFKYHNSCVILEGHASTGEKCSAFTYMVNFILNTTAAGLSDKSESRYGLAIIDCSMLSVRDLDLLFQMLSFYNDHVEKLENYRKEMKEND